jgi:hypothetical protein
MDAFPDTTFGAVVEGGICPVTDLSLSLGNINVNTGMPICRAVRSTGPRPPDPDLLLA